MVVALQNKCRTFIFHYRCWKNWTNPRVDSSVLSSALRSHTKWTVERPLWKWVKSYCVLSLLWLSLVGFMHSFHSVL